ncbi:MAG: putative Calcium/calmodulin-dependent protein kinase type 1, partial [Streblomastix strix]
MAYNEDLGIVAARVMQLDKFDQREWNLAATLIRPEFACPFILKYLLAKPLKTEVVILMEYANAQSVEVIIKNQKYDLPRGAYRALAQQILEGVRVIHSAGLVHKTIKAESIMLHSTRGSIKVKISDFGLTKIDSKDRLELMSMETLFSMAPELLLGSFETTNKVDMWSVGVVLYQLATHEYPIVAEDLQGLKYKIRQKEIERPPQIRDDDLWDLLQQMLEQYPGRRISAEQALMHPYFTSIYAQKEVSVAAKKLAHSFAYQKGDSWIMRFDMDQTSIIPTSELLKFYTTHPEADEKVILLTQKGEQEQIDTQLQQYPDPETMRSSRFEPLQEDIDPNDNSNIKDYNKEKIVPFTLEQLRSTPDFLNGKIINQEQYITSKPIKPLTIHNPRIRVLQDTSYSPFPHFNLNQI